MRLLWAIVLGVIGGIALAWWLGQGDRRGRGDAAPQPAAVDATTTVYRWRDAQGVLHVSSQPPTDGTPYERVRLRDDQNVIPLGTGPEPD